MRVALYLRVSTVEQADQGYSLENQQHRLEAFAASQGWDDVALYMDDGFTGTDMNRPGLKRLIRHCEEKQIQAVVVMKLDRLSRKQKDALYLLEDVFEKHGVIFKSATEPFDTSTPLGKAMIGVLAVFAQLERDMIVERTTAGRRTRVKQGKWYGGPDPFGYRWNKEADELEVVPEEADIVQEIFTRYQQGQSCLSLAEWAATKSTARSWWHNTIRDMLNRPIYMGKLANAGTLEEGNHEAIIEPQQWYETQIEVSRRKDGMTPLGEYLLTGLLRCGVCGGPIVHVKRKTKPNQKPYVYELYACMAQHVRKKDRKNNCTLGYFRREAVEKLVTEEIKSLSFGNKRDNVVKELNKLDQKDNSEIISSIEAKLDVVKTGIENLYDGIQSGAIKASSVSDRIKKLETEQEALLSQLDDIKDRKPKQHTGQQMVEILKQLSEVWDFMTDDERKIATRKVILNVTLMPDANHQVKWNTIQ